MRRLILLLAGCLSLASLLGLIACKTANPGWTTGSNPDRVQPVKF